MIEDVCIVNGEWVALTDWYPPSVKPVRPGNYRAQFFDAGWMYDWTVYWDDVRQLWLDREGGSSLIDQNLTWRGQTA
ncbi:hypothetical protein LMG22037_05518 [Paraburkholderia phenoliruptrix]|uniref:Uncharacterized protein n=1 Tax=Paraburkholderia phenoliruptrix TaxID=252970 RepID=A0A6J5CBA4_9BURK|nr:hypothetical protein [Paraburkholderia phenoliruptrix]CAB3730242.1 hypothetical protein LMG22037_05518 [Paraburkholderia phenoliruptrix]